MNEPRSATTGNPGATETAEQAVGRQVKALRAERGWSQQKLATVMTRLGSSWRQSTVAKTEAADRPIRMNEVADLATAFGVPISSVLGQPAPDANRRFSDERTGLVSEDGRRPSTVRMGSDGIRHTLIIDGIDLSRGMRSAQLTLAANELPTLVLDPIIFNLDAVELRDARVTVASEAAKALVALGWTPPADQPTSQPTGDDRHAE